MRVSEYLWNIERRTFCRANLHRRVFDHACKTCSNISKHRRKAKRSRKQRMLEKNTTWKAAHYCSSWTEWVDHLGHLARNLEEVSERNTISRRLTTESTSVMKKQVWPSVRYALRDHSIFRIRFVERIADRRSEMVDDGSSEKMDSRFDWWRCCSSSIVDSQWRWGFSSVADITIGSDVSFSISVRWSFWVEWQTRLTTQTRLKTQRSRTSGKAFVAYRSQSPNWFIEQKLIFLMTTKMMKAVVICWERSFILIR